MENSRRDFLKKSAVAGGIVWASPILTSLPAHADHPGGTPCPGGDCTGSARALFVDPPILGGTEYGVDKDPANTNTDPTGFDACVLAPELVIAGADVICGDYSDVEGHCNARAEVAGANTISPTFPLEVTFTALTSQASAGDAGCPTGSSNVTNLTVEGTTIANVSGSESATLTATTAAGTFTVVVNEKVCEDGMLVVRALRITGTGDAEGTELIVAESIAGNPACCPGCGLE